jgi:serine/threonine protein kinase
MKYFQLIRKEFKPYSKVKSDYDLELRNLSILKLIKHPNIIELLGCYTYRGKHNLVFPFARDGSLADLLRGNHPSPFRTNHNLLLALCGLSSALRAVHEFFSDDLQAIGCHHDLKPSNILIDGEEFLLADFGLSRFKDVSEDSKSLFRGGIGDHIAPECEELDGDFKMRPIRRSSDIWSFGCILSEILTYMVKGSSGVQTFREKRMFEIENWKYYRFHRGTNAVNQNAMDWITNMEDAGSKPEQLMACLIRRMLSLKPEERPIIKEVNARLRFIVINALTGPIEELFVVMCNKSHSIVALLEWRRFASWQWVLETAENDVPDGGADFLGEISDQEFQAVLSRLEGVVEALQVIIPECENSRSRLFLPLRNVNDFLLNILPNEYQSSAMLHLESHMLETEDPKLLGDISSSLEDSQSTPGHQIGLLAAIKRLNVLVSNKTGSGGRSNIIDPKSLQCRHVLEDFYTSEILDPETQRTNKMLVEWKIYEDHFSDDKIANELFARLEAVADLLNSAHTMDTLRVLHCRGFYHESSNYALGLVYDFPSNPQSVGDEGSGAEVEDQLEATTLRKILTDDSRGKHRPLLGDRFRLAHKLAASVLEFHKINWLQESISSFNIAFFYNRGSSWTQSMQSPYFLGFLSSRQNEESAFTEGPTDDARHKDYQHPEYLRGKERFRAEFDYYSLGLTLLELGLWSSLDKIIASSDCVGRSPEDVREMLLKKRVPHLGQAMGELYQCAVDVCLRGNFIDKGSSSLETCLKFKEQVVDRLASCKA